MPKQSRDQQKADALLGGREISIQLPDGTEESIFVRQVKASELMDFLNAMDNEVNLISMVTGKTPDWIDTLSTSRPDQYAKLADAANEVNLDFFSSWFRRQRNRRKSLSGTSGQAG